MTESYHLDGRVSEELTIVNIPQFSKNEIAVEILFAFNFSRSQVCHMPLKMFNPPDLLCLHKSLVHLEN